MHLVFKYIRVQKLHFLLKKKDDYFLGTSAEQTQPTQTADEGILSKIKKALLG